MLSTAECTELIQLYEANRHRPELARHYGENKVAHYVNFPRGSKERQLIASVAQRVRKLVEDWYEPTYIEWAGVVCLPPGGLHTPHADNERWDKKQQAWVPNHTPERSYSALLYLSTWGWDFGGGQFQFVDPFNPQKIKREIEPAAGMVVAFPSTRHFFHQVPSIEWGSRYSFPVWFTQNPALDLLSK